LLNFVKSKKFIIIIVTIVTLIVIGLSSRAGSKVNWLSNIINVPLAPLQKFFTFSAGKIEDGISFFKDIKEVKQENEYLKERLAELEGINRELESLKMQNEELRQSLNLKDRFDDYEIMGANVIAKDPGNWFSVFTIDRGTKDGIVMDKKGMYSGYYPVITNQGLVGRVDSSNAFSSKVISIIDEDSTVSGLITKSRHMVIVRGDLELREKGLCIVEYISPDADIGPGDTIETSGLGGIYPKGIIIGTVKEVIKSPNSIDSYAILEPAVDFQKLERVYVLKSNYNEE